ncbi:MAG: tol-pal system protein YbgF [Gammaproteobacteria bacterium]
MIKWRWGVWIGAVAAVAVLAGCSTSVPLNDPVYTRIDALQQQVSKLQKRIKGEGLMNVASGQQQLTQQMADLQGQIQDLQHQLARQQQHERAVDQNFDQRLTTLEGGKPAGFTNTGATGTSGNSSNSSGSVATAPSNSGTSGSSQSSDYAAYQAAFGKLRSGDNAGAITAFQQFIQRYPNSRFVPNAWYWMAETHYVNGQYKDAISNFKQVLTKYPNSPKAADSQLKIGYAQYALKDYKGARTTFRTVIKKYPGTTPADLAKQRLQKMGSQGR